MRFGDKSTFAIECELCSTKNTTAFGSIRIWIANQQIGDFAEQTMIGVLAHGLISGKTIAAKDKVSEFQNMNEHEIFGHLENQVYREKYSSASANYYQYRWLEGAPLEEGFMSFIVPCGEKTLLIWRHWGRNVEHYAVKSDEYLDAVSSFEQWLNENT